MVLTLSNLIGAAEQRDAEAWQILHGALEAGGPRAAEVLPLLGAMRGEEPRRILEGIFKGKNGIDISSAASGLSPAQCAAFLPLLKQAALDPAIESRTKLGVLGAIARTGTPEAAQALIGIANDEPEPIIAGAAFGVLGEMGPVAEDVLVKEVEAGPSAWHRETATWVLVRGFGPRRSGAAFRVALHDPDWKVRFAGAMGLARSGSPEGQGELEKVAHGNDLVYRVEALAALTALGVSQSASELRGVLTGTDRAASLKAVSAIVGIGGEKLKALVFDLGLERKPEFETIIAGELLDPGDPRDAVVLTKMLDDGDEISRIVAAERLFKGHPTAQARNVIVRALQSGNAQARQVAVDFATGEPSLWPDLGNFLAAVDPAVREAAIAAAGKLRRRKDVTLLTQYLRDESPGISLAAARSLAAVDPVAAQTAFQDGLKSDVWYVRVHCAAMLLSHRGE
ncbi:MAG: HEAT repeat domain-containing protein [Bryobacteraceae bacterium]